MSWYLIGSLAAILAYTAFALYIGLGKAYDKKAVSTSRGYFIGSGTGYFILFFTTAATWFSTWIYMGAPGSFYQNGIGWVAGMTWQLFIMYLMGTFGPRFWRLSVSKDYITPADLLSDYYKSNGMRYIVSLGQLIFCIPYLMAQVTGVGLAVSTLTNDVIPFWAGVLYAAVIVGIYVFFGGFKSQAWVDTMQGIMFVVILWISVVIMMTQTEIPGIAGFFSQLELASARLLRYFNGAKDWNWQKYLSFFFIQAIGGYFAPYVWQRSYAAKSGRIVKKIAGTLGPFYAFAVMLPVMLVGFGGAILFPEIANSDSILVATMAKYAPAMGIFVVIGIMAAGMSTISSIVVSASSLVSIDFYKRLKKNVTDEEVHNSGKIGIITLMVISIVLSMMKIQGIVLLVNTALAGFCQIVFAVIGVFHWHKATKEGVIIGFLSGLIITLVLTAENLFFLGFAPGFWGLVGNGVLFITISLMTKPLSKEHISNYLQPLTSREHI